MSSPLHSAEPSSTVATLLGQGWALSSECRSFHERSRSLSGDFSDLQVLVTAAQLGLQCDEIDVHGPNKRKRVYKKRKSTHLVRKEEKQGLEADIQDLKTTIEGLKLRASIHNGEEDVLLLKQTAHNSELRDALQEQHLTVARTQAMLAGCSQHHSFNVRPMETYIHLATDHSQRQDTLRTVREPKLQYARRFIESRSLGLHPTANYYSEERYETPQGDYCNVRFDRTPLRGVKGGVCAVFDALKNAVFNAEIILSEASGNITIREDDDLDDIGMFSQMKLVTQTASNVLVENNLVHFSELFQADKESNTYALATADFVDQDDRFPYCSRERIRRDATSAMLVTSHTDTNLHRNSRSVSYGGYTSSEEESGEPVVVLTRWTFTRICRTEINVPNQLLQEMRDQSGRVSETILNCVRETLGLLK